MYVQEENPHCEICMGGIFIDMNMNHIALDVPVCTEKIFTGSSVP